MCRASSRRTGKRASRPPRFGEVYANAHEAGLEAAYLNARLIAHDLAEVGINVDCLPVLDVPVEGADAVIGDRAFALDPAADHRSWPRGRSRG